MGSEMCIRDSENESMALMQCPSVLSAPTLMGHFYSLKATLQPPHTSWRSDVVLAATPNQVSSGHRRCCSSSTIDKESMALMQCPSVLSAPTLMGHFYSLKATLQPPHKIWRSAVVLAATPNQVSSGRRRCCSSSTIDKESMALMQCPSVLSAPSLMGHFYSLNALL